LASVINAKRLHHQLVPMRIDYEEGFDNQTLQALEKIGHLTHRLPPEKGFSAVTAISRSSGVLEAIPDARRHGSAEVY
jgi:gamma-glutamyltranspeptidase/glutathione hydrolase/leukotriene-C4 hydrolase